MFKSLIEDGNTRKKSLVFLLKKEKFNNRIYLFINPDYKNKTYYSLAYLSQTLATTLL